jgi:hypothetical protein
MVVVGTSLMPLKAIGKETCLWARTSSRLSKDLGPKKHPNTWKREESKEVWKFMKVEEGGVHCNRYNGHYMKQCVKIPKAT